jgi:hypothetical protein
MSRVPAGASELTRRGPARRISGQEVPAGVRLRSLRCSLGSTIKDVELGVAYQRVAAGMLSAMLFLAALVSIGYHMELGAVQTKLCRNPPSHGVHVWSPKSGKDTDSALIRSLRNWRQLQSRAPGNRAHYAQQRAVCKVVAALHAADLASAKTLVLQPRTRRTICASRQAVGRPAAPLTARHMIQAVTSRMCASGSQDFMREA